MPPIYSHFALEQDLFHKVTTKLLSVWLSGSPFKKVTQPVCKYLSIYKLCLPLTQAARQYSGLFCQIVFTWRKTSVHSLHILVVQIICWKFCFLTTVTTHNSRRVSSIFRSLALSPDRSELRISDAYRITSTWFYPLFYSCSGIQAWRWIWCLLFSVKLEFYYSMKVIIENWMSLSNVKSKSNRRFEEDYKPVTKTYSFWVPLQATVLVLSNGPSNILVAFIYSHSLILVQQKQHYSLSLF